MKRSGPILTLASGALEELWAGGALGRRSFGPEELWADRPVEPYWQMFNRLQAAVEELPHQRLRGPTSAYAGFRRKSGERLPIFLALFGTVDLFDAMQIDLMRPGSNFPLP